MGPLLLTCALTFHKVSLAPSALKDGVVQATATLNGDILDVHFDVQKPVIYGKEKFDLPTDYPYKYDVVEVYVSVKGDDKKLKDKANLPYFEFELTPFGQTFAVQINRPKKDVINGIDKGATYSTEHSDLGWTGDFHIPLKALGWEGDPKKITGNLFSSLGMKPDRSHWSTYLPAMKNVDFHQPRYFGHMVDCAK